MQTPPSLTFADPVLADLIERARAAQMVAAAAQSAVWSYIDRCQQGTAAPELDGWPSLPDHPDLLSVPEAASRASRSADTIGRWCRTRGIGKMYGGRWRVSIRRLNDTLA